MKTILADGFLVQETYGIQIAQYRSRSVESDVHLVAISSSALAAACSSSALGEP
jgi:hypothetical protein